MVINMYKNNNGSVLAISLVILTAITLISIFSIERSGLQTKIVSNLQHAEKLYNASLNEQEYWTSELSKSNSGDVTLSAPLSNFSLDEDYNQSYLPVELVPMAEELAANDKGSELLIEDMNPITLTNELLYVPNAVGKFSLAEGEEANERIDYHLKLTSTSEINLLDLQSVQTTGISFSGINITRNSL